MKGQNIIIMIIYSLIQEVYRNQIGNTESEKLSHILFY